MFPRLSSLSCACVFFQGIETRGLVKRGPPVNPRISRSSSAAERFSYLFRSLVVLWGRRRLPRPGWGVELFFALDSAKMEVTVMLSSLHANTKEQRALFFIECYLLCAIGKNASPSQPHH